MTIGIIGGAGVAAANKLNELLEEHFTKNGAFRDAHHPEIIMWQATKAPSRSMYLEGKGESFIEDYIDIAKKLKYCGADKICMNCNTAHYAIDTISKEADVKFLNLVEECVKKISQTEAKSIGLVASDGCLKGKVYEKYFEKICPQVKVIYPDDEYQTLVTKGICNIKNNHRFDNIDSEERPMNIFKKVREHLISKGAEKVIMGCTDIRVDYYNKEDIDSLEVLKELIIKEYESLRK